MSLGGHPLPLTAISPVGFSAAAVETTTGLDALWRRYTPGPVSFGVVRFRLSNAASGAYQDGLEGVEDWWAAIQAGGVQRRDLTLEITDLAGAVETGLVLAECLPLSFDPIAMVMTVQVGRIDVNVLRATTVQHAYVEGSSPFGVVSVNNSPLAASSLSGGNTVVEFATTVSGTDQTAKPTVAKQRVAPLQATLDLKGLKGSAVGALEDWVRAALQSQPSLRDVKLDLQVMTPGGTELRPTYDLAEVFLTKVEFIGPTLLRSDGRLPAGIAVTMQAHYAR